MGKSSDVVVIGAGIAGMQSALLLAEKDHHVYLLDSSPAIGGFFPLLDRTFPTNSCGRCFMSPKAPAYCPIYENEFHDNIELLTNCDVQEVRGRAGDFEVTYTARPRHVDIGKCELCHKCVEVCPVEVDRELGGGLEKRRAIYLPFMQAIPRCYVIDEKACTKCGECLKVCSPGAINLEGEARERVIRAGAIVLGFGFEPSPGEIKGEYGLGRYENVLSSVQYERLLSTSGPTQGQPIRLSDGKKIKRLAFIQCVGSRDRSCGQEYCSSVCCRIATKQAMISKERHAGMDIAVFYLDIRAMGKEYELYYERARDHYKIRYLRSAVSTIRELQQSKDLLILYGLENGELKEEVFDAVVLSVGFSPPGRIQDLAEKIGVELNEYNFCATEEFHPTVTSLPGVFVAGAFREPRDIPESVVDGCSAAADAASLLGRVETVQETGSWERREKDEIINEKALRFGIFVCDRFNFIKKRLNILELIDRLSLDKDIRRVKRVDFTDMQQGLNEIKDLIQEHGLNRIIIAGYRCLEIHKYIKKHTGVLGTYSNLFSLANIGEQCANVHLDNPQPATEKAYLLIRAGMEKIKYVVPRKQRKRKLQSRVLVVGGGLSGLSSCLCLAEQGIEVILVEREKELGGNARFAYYTLKGSDVQSLLKEMVSSADEHPGIEILKSAELSKLDGTWGNFRSLVSVEGEAREIRHGAVIFAVGGQEIKPEGYLYGENPNVISQREFERLLYHKEKKIAALETIAMIQCVNCRNEKHPYCSRICCTHAVKNALKLKELNPEADICVFYRDIRTYGFYEKYYREARDKGVLFIRYEPEDNPQVRAKNGGLELTFLDRIIGEKMSLNPDLLILSNGIEPYHNERLADIAGLELNRDGFFAEANPKSAPLDSVDRGKYFCGICHSPNLMENVICQGKAAAIRAAVLLWGELGEFSDIRVFVNERLCAGCGICVSVCPYSARVIDELSNKARVIDELCKGCGTCAVSCPNGASEQYDFERKTMLRVIDRMLV